MNPQTQIKTLKLSAVSERDTQFSYNNAKFTALKRAREWESNGAVQKQITSHDISRRRAFDTLSIELSDELILLATGPAIYARASCYIAVICIRGFYVFANFPEEGEYK